MLPSGIFLLKQIKMFVNYIQLCFAFLITKASIFPHGLQFTPTSRVLEAIVGEDFHLGYQHHPAVTKCYYSIDRGEFKSFDVLHIHSKIYQPTKPQSTNDIYEEGKNGKCMIVMRNVDKNGPKLLVMIAGSNSKNYTSQYVSVFIKETLEVFALNKEIYVTIGGTYRVGFDENEAIVNCYIEVDDQRFYYSIYNATYTNRLVEGASDIRNITNFEVHSFSTYGLCQFNIIPRAVGSNRINIQAYNKNGKSLGHNEIKVNYFDKEEIQSEPKSGKVYAIPAMYFHIGLTKHEAIRECYFESTKGHFVHILLVKDRFSLASVLDINRLDDRNVFHISGKADKCDISIPYWKGSADAWTITASDGINNITSRTIHIYNYTATVAPQPINVGKVVHALEGGEYIVGFTHSSYIKMCLIRSTNVHYTLNLHESEDHNATELKQSTIPYHEVWSLEAKGLCQIRVKNVTFGHYKKYWVFTFVNENDKIIPLPQTVIVVLHPADSIKPTQSIKDVYNEEGSENKIGFQKHPAISQCYIETSAGFTESVAIMYNNSFSYTTSTFKLYGDLCQVDAGYTSYRDPIAYTITASNGVYNMTSKSFIVYSYDTKIRGLLTNVVDIAATQSFIQYLRIPSVTFTKCTLSTRELVITYDMNTRIIEKQDGIVGMEVMPLNFKDCGFQIMNLTRRDIVKNLIWHIIGTDSSGALYGNKFHLRLIELNYPRSIKIPVILGENATVACHVTVNRGFCELYNPQNELIQRQKTCSYFLEMVAIDDLGKWKCIYSEVGSFDSQEYIAELVGDDSLGVSTSIMEGAQSLIISCTAQSKLDACVIMSPTKEHYLIRPGLATERYTTTGTNLTDGICVLQIEKPLEEYEKGVWTCELRKENRVFGDRIKVGNGRVPDYMRNFTLNVKAQEDFVIDCEIPEYSSNCYIISPSGEAFFDQRSFQPYFGRCALQVSQDYASKNGLWKCAFSEPGKIKDDIIEINVEVEHFTPKYSTVQVKTGKRLELLYLSGKEPLIFCFFVSPQNKSFYLGSTSKSYFGLGLQYGECGITIQRTTPEDYGIWTCITKIGWNPSRKPIVTKILVQDPDLETARIAEITNPDNTTLGTGSIMLILGLITLIGGLGIFAYNKFSNVRY